MYVTPTTRVLCRPDGHEPASLRTVLPDQDQRQKCLSDVEEMLGGLGLWYVEERFWQLCLLLF